MRAFADDCLAALVDYLCNAAQRRLTPARARAELAALFAAHPALDWRLVATWQEHSEAYEFDVLVRHHQIAGTLCIAFNQERNLPWTLIGAQRWSERDFVRVNDSVLKVEDVVASLDFIWSEMRIALRLVDLCLMRAELERAPVAVGDAELQQGMDDFRRRHGLHTVAATDEWLQRRGLTQPGLERRIADELAFTKLIDRIVANEVKDYFEAHRDDFAIVELARYWFRDEVAAALAHRELSRGAGMHLRSAGDSARGTSAKMSLDAVCLIELTEADRELARTVPLGAATLRRAPDGGHEVLLVLANRQPTLNDHVRALIKKILFNRWLDAQRKQAAIEWNWGDRVETDQVTAAARLA
jgi:putative peptide maturation system protein